MTSVPARLATAADAAGATAPVMGAIARSGVTPDDAGPGQPVQPSVEGTGVTDPGAAMAAQERGLER